MYLYFLFFRTDCLVKLNSERSFLVKFGIFAPWITFLSYSIQTLRKGTHDSGDETDTCEEKVTRGNILHSQELEDSIQP